MVGVHWLGENDPIRLVHRALLNKNGMGFPGVSNDHEGKVGVADGRCGCRPKQTEWPQRPPAQGTRPGEWMEVTAERPFEYSRFTAGALHLKSATHLWADDNFQIASEEDGQSGLTCSWAIPYLSSEIVSTQEASCSRSLPPFAFC